MAKLDKESARSASVVSIKLFTSEFNKNLPILAENLLLIINIYLALAGINLELERRDFCRILAYLTLCKQL